MDWKQKLVVGIAGAIIIESIVFFLMGSPTLTAGVVIFLLVSVPIFLTIDKSKSKSFIISLLIQLIPIICAFVIIMNDPQSIGYMLLTLPLWLAVSLVLVLIITFVFNPLGRKIFSKQ